MTEANAPPPGAAVRRDRWIVAGLGCLLLLAGASLAGLDRYKALAGAAAPTPGTWPPGTGLELEPGLPVLVAFIHPLCPCSRASLAELRTLAHRFGSEVQALALFELPAEPGEEWTSQGRWEQARAIPGLQVAVDAGGRAAALLGAETSGHVVLYDGRGALVYSGGITPARGHEGQNAGLTRIATWLDGARGGKSPSGAGFPVFGCPLAKAD